MNRKLAALLFFLFALPSFASKDTPWQTLDWSGGGSPVLHLSFSKFSNIGGGIAKERTYVTETVIENVSDRALSSVDLLLYVYDKAHARVGDGSISLTNVAPHQIVKLEVTLRATGVPASISLATEAAQTLSITINSVPQGAVAVLDGKELGTTPKLAEVSRGKHMIEFTKEGYATGHFPFELGPRDTSGGSVTYELGASSHDSLELRDGSLVSGDLISMDGMQVEVRVGGSIQTYARNQVKRISLVARDPVPQ